MFRDGAAAAQQSAQPDQEIEREKWDKISRKNFGQFSFIYIIHFRAQQNIFHIFTPYRQSLDVLFWELRMKNVNNN